MSTFVTTCRGTTCGVKVVMTDDITGRRHPFDWPPEPCEVCDGQGKIIVTHPPTLFEPTERKSQEPRGAGVST